jgi:hypothetical protein
MRPCAWAATTLAVLAIPVPAFGAPVIAAAGDIACRPGLDPTRTTCRQAWTAALLVGHPRIKALLALGDEQYPSGAFGDFRGSYRKTWGRVRGKTRPVPGNHEYREPWARGYFRYFGARAGPHGKGWYAYRPERPRDLRPSSRRWSVPDWLPPLAAMGPSTPASRLRAAVLGVESPCDGHELGRSAIRAPLLRRAPPTGLTPGGLGRRPGQ